jgi:ribonuclease HII
MLKTHYTESLLEAGCDEAGRGCLAGPVFAASVVLPEDFRDERINDSKKLTEKQRNELRAVIEHHSVAWAVSSVDALVIDRINILNASILAIHQAIRNLDCLPQLLLIDGNRFKSYGRIPHLCIVKGDSKYMSIAAASILAKTHRDEFMKRIHDEFPQYDWKNNKGYPCRKHREAIAQIGISSYHRKSFRLAEQLKLTF